jgi:hypothetical protein
MFQHYQAAFLSDAPVQLALLLSQIQPAEQLQAYPVDGGGKSTQDPLTALA